MSADQRRRWAPNRAVAQSRRQVVPGRRQWLCTPREATRRRPGARLGALIASAQARSRPIALFFPPYRLIVTVMYFGADWTLTAVRLSPEFGCLYRGSRSLLTRRRNPQRPAAAPPLDRVPGSVERDAAVSGRLDCVLPAPGPLPVAASGVGALWIPFTIYFTWMTSMTVATRAINRQTKEFISQALRPA
jgi:hypothetical protein